MMLNDLYKNNQFGIPNISEYTDGIIDNYVKAFYEKNQKRTTFTDEIATQNTNVRYPKQINTIYVKPDSKPK